MCFRYYCVTLTWSSQGDLKQKQPDGIDEFCEDYLRFPLWTRLESEAPEEQELLLLKWC